MKDHFFIYRRTLFGFALAILAGCSSQQKSLNANQTPPVGASEIPDYSNTYYWAAHPSKYDPSDSTPKPYREFVKDSSVDVFFLYPTSYTDYDVIDAKDLSNPLERKKWNASVNDVKLNKQTDASSILYQASVFNRYQVFAPRYRQAHYESFFIADTIAKPFFDTAYADILAAFEYYLKYYNHGRPFILASHSQGTVHALRLIKEQIENSGIEKQLLAAYLPGVPVKAGYFEKCKPCTDPSQTGCFVSWRTFRKGYTPGEVVNDAVVVNPLTWRQNDELAQKQYNAGAVLYKFNKPIKHAVSAQVHDDVLWVSKPHFWGSIFFTRKNYHIGDYNLFWKNIRENVDERVEAYKKEMIGNIGSR